MAERVNLSSESPWEDRVGYSRAVRSGEIIFVSGTTSADSAGDAPVGGDDAAAQAREAMHRIEAALEKLGGSLDQVVRTRIYLRNIADWPEVGSAHQEFFGEIKPASTMLEVSSLIDERLLVEIEAEAHLRSD